MNAIKDAACVILSYNHPQLTLRTLESVSKVFVPEQIHLVHNGSRAETEAMLRTQLPAVNHLTISENQGYAAGANFGLSRAFSKHQWALFLTNDTALVESGPMPQRPGIYGPLLLRRKTALVDSLGGGVSYFNANIFHCRSVNEFLGTKHRYIPGTAFWMDRDSFHHTQGFDCRLHTYWEDVDLGLRCQKLGVHLGLAPQWRIAHGIGKTCHKDPFYTTYLFQRNRTLILRKHSRDLGSGFLRWWSQQALSRSQRGLMKQFILKNDIVRQQLLSKALAEFANHEFLFKSRPASSIDD